MRFNSTIKQKKCKCGCDKYPTLGYKGYYKLHLPSEKFPSKTIDPKTKSKLKSDYIKIADSLFSKFIKRRDSLEGNKNITCICCKKTYNLQDKTPDGKYVIEALHFVSRSNYLLRYSERNVNAGCCYCNLDMHLFPDGKAYKAYKQYLIDMYGEEEIEAMESSKREIHKISENYLLNIIEKYKIK